MEFLVKSVTVARSKLKFLRSRQAVFIYATMFYLVFMLLHKPKFIPGAEFSSNKESPHLRSSDPSYFLGISKGGCSKVIVCTQARRQSNKDHSFKLNAENMLMSIRLGGYDAL